MRTRATTEELTGTTGSSAAAPTDASKDASRDASKDASPGWWHRLGARIQGDYEEDGTFRPVRLSPWVDILISLGIVVFMAACFVGFFVWLAVTQ